MPAARTSITIKSRPLTEGRVSWFLYFRPALPDGTSLMPVEGFDRPEDRPKVEAFAKPYREALKSGSTAPKQETADAWYDRFIKSRMGKVSTADTDHKQWLKWISKASVRGGSTTFGALPIVAVTADDVEDVRDALNRAVEEWEAAGKVRGTGISYSTAANLWSILVTAMKHASTRKGDRALRVREVAGLGNPAEGIGPPKVGKGKRRHWCRSAWLNAALASPLNDREIKEAVAIGVGLHLRPGELHELRVKDLDLDAGEVRITRSYDEQKKRVKDGAKTDEGVRTVTIPDWLAPLLESIATSRKPGDRVAPWLAKTSEHDRAPALRTFLQNGGKVPAHVLEDTATHEMVDFRTVRDTGITLRFLAGERAEVVQREAGHEHITTTLGYAKEVANKGARYGDAFLTLPDELTGRNENGAGAEALCAVSSELGSPADVNGVNRTSVFPEKMVARVGFEPTTFGL